MGAIAAVVPSRTEALRNSLLALCSELGPGGKLPTVRTLAASLGASTSTLDRVLGDLEREGRILRRHGSGIYVAAAKRATTIALVTGVDPFAVGQSPFYQLTADLLRRRITAEGHDVKFYLDAALVEKTGVPSRDELLADLDSGRLLGLVLIGISRIDLIELLNEREIPYIALMTDAKARWRFTLPHYTLIEPGLAQLVKAGCRRPCLLTWDGFGGEAELCYAAFRAALQSHGLPLLPGAIWTRSEHLPDDDIIPRQLFGIKAAKALFGPAPRAFDSLLCTDDMLCLGALAAFPELGVVPGRDLLVATHTNKGSPVLAHATRGILKLQVDVAAMVAEAMNLFERRLAGEHFEPFTKLTNVEIVA